MSKVQLSWLEMMVAAQVGAARNIQSLKQNWEPAAGVGLVNSWTLNAEGAAGEMAVAKLLNVYWEPIAGDSKASDVGPFQVRTNISRKHTDLCLRPKDRDDRIYISVLSFAPIFEVVGWITGADGKQQKWLRAGAPDRPDCFYVPRSELHAIAELPLSGAA